MRLLLFDSLIDASREKQKHLNNTEMDAENINISAA